MDALHLVSPLPTLRERLQRVIWRLALLFVLGSAALQWVSGLRDNLVQTLAFTVLVLVCMGLEGARVPVGRGLFLAALPPFLLWLIHSPGVGPAFVPGFVGYAAVLLLPIALAAVWFRWPGAVLFTLYALGAGALTFPLSAQEGPAVVWNVLLALATGGVLTWLLDTGEAAIAQLHQTALVDSLTGLGNRRAMEEALRAAWDANPEQVGLALLDIDNLKVVNDRQGHEAGDRLLRLVAQALREVMSRDGTVFRLGGDEYVILCRAEQLPGLQARIGSALGALRFGGLPRVTASVGLVAGTEADDPGRLLALADGRMYGQKRNRPHARTTKVVRGPVLPLAPQRLKSGVR